MRYTVFRPDSSRRVVCSYSFFTLPSLTEDTSFFIICLFWHYVYFLSYFYLFVYTTNVDVLRRPEKKVSLHHFTSVFPYIFFVILCCFVSCISYSSVDNFIRALKWPSESFFRRDKGDIAFSPRMESYEPQRRHLFIFQGEDNFVAVCAPRSSHYGLVLSSDGEVHLGVADMDAHNYVTPKVVSFEAVSLVQESEESS